MAMNQKWFFLYALIVTLIVFNLGIYMGYKLESFRIDKINDFYLESEMNLLDQRIQSESLDIFNLDCDKVIQANINFGDQIYEEAKKIEKFEGASRINNDIVFYHKRFDILRTLFWVNSVKIKNQCNADYHTIVYFYRFQDKTLEQKAAQSVYSNFLSELKNKYGNSIMLIPIAADGDIPSIDLLLAKYDITEFPVILVDEKIKIGNIDSLNEIEQYLD